MNTSKQVNVMLGLLMVFLIGTLLYFLWDSVRADDATDRQLRDNAERGASLFSLNCRACHGLTGKGVLETSSLPAVPLNLAENRPTDPGKLSALQARFKDTITCGRVGTVMPPWSQAQGGSLNDFQIEQLVALITSAASEDGWKHAMEVASFGDHLNTGDRFKPPKHLLEDISATVTSLKVNEAHGVKATDLLRIDDEPTDDVYEIVMVVDAPASSVVTDDVSADQTVLPVQLATAFRRGDNVTIGDEHLTVVDAPASTVLAADAPTAGNSISVQDATGISADSTLVVEGERIKVTSVSGSTLTVDRGVEDTQAKDHKADAVVIEVGREITVSRGTDGTEAAKHRAKTPVLEAGDTIEAERGAFGTVAAGHTAGTEVFLGPIQPANSITGGTGGTPPCGQKAAAPAATPGPAVAVSGTVAMAFGDNFFDLNGNRNPNMSVTAGTTVTFNLANNGTAIHNMRIAGLDGKFGTDDDVVSDPRLVPGGASATLNFAPPQAGTFAYECEFHPNDMKGEIAVSQ